MLINIGNELQRITDMSVIGKKIRGLALGAFATVSAVTGTQAQENKQFFMPDASKNLLEHMLKDTGTGITVDSLQWDIVRDRDLAGKNQCRDRDGDGVADLEPDGNGMRVEQELSQFILVINNNTLHDDITRGVTREEAIKKMETLKDGSGLLLSPHGLPKGQLEPIMVISRLNGETKVTRPLSVQPVGDFGSGRVDCNKLTIPSIPKR